MLGELENSPAFDAHPYRGRAHQITTLVQVGREKTYAFEVIF